MRAFILLGVNCALGASDIAQVPRSAIHPQGGWLTFPRIKTGVPRWCKLWTATITAIKPALEKRPEPIDRADAGLSFFSRKVGRWVQPSKRDDIAKWASRRDLISYAFQRLTVRDAVAVGKGFYSLRRAFQTAAEESVAGSMDADTNAARNSAISIMMLADSILKFCRQESA